MVNDYAKTNFFANPSLTGNAKKPIVWPKSSYISEENVQNCREQSTVRHSQQNEEVLV